MSSRVTVGPATPPVTRGAVLEIDLDAVARNTALLAARAPTLMAVVKADGFGHGAADVARTALAHGATSLGVTSLSEALRLRGDGLTAPLLSWLNPTDGDFGAALAAGIDIAVPDVEHLHAVVVAATAAGPQTPAARIHLHLDTGLARDGAAPETWPALCRAARRAERQRAVRVVGLMGHLAHADHPGHPANAEGRHRFARGVLVARATGLRPPMRHLAATSATLTDPAAAHTLCRVGAGLVGIDPSGTHRLHPAMRVTAPVIGVRRVRPGTAVGYGGTWTAPRAATLALLGLGYADGLPRAASGRAEVWLRGRRRPVAGVISMDQVVVDLGNDDVTLGETATLVGPGADGEPTAAEWARWAGTIEHEVVTGLGARSGRVRRVTLPAGVPVSVAS